jgi:hypothetical protein
MKTLDRIESLLADAERLTSLGRSEAARARLIQLDGCIRVYGRELSADFMSKVLRLRNLLESATTLV